MAEGGRGTTGEESVNRTWLGVGIVAILALALVLVLASSGDDGPTPTTTEAPIAAPTTSPPATTAPTTGPPITTTTAAPTTTLDPEARAAEIETLVRDLEFALIEALYNQDSDALAGAVVGKSLWDRLQAALESPSDFFSKAPTPGEFSLELQGVVIDRADCIVADIEEDPTAFLTADGEVERLVIVLWPIPEAETGWRVAERWAEGTPSSEWTRNCDLQDRSWRP
jgi:hypothetical protein